MTKRIITGTILKIDSTGKFPKATTRHLTMQLDIDWERLADHLAARLYKSKTGRSRMLGGIIKARLVGFKPQPE